MENEDNSGVERHNISLPKECMQFVEENSIGLSKFVRKKLQEEMVKKSPQKEEENGTGTDKECVREAGL